MLSCQSSPVLNLSRLLGHRQQGHVYLLLLLLMAAFSMEGANTISGRVTNANTGLPITGADIDVFDLSTNLSVAITDLAGGNAITDASGNYTVQLPTPGTYILRIDMDPTAPLADRYYGNVLLKSQATPISVVNNADVTGINIQLVTGYAISGSVTGSGALLPNVDLDVYEAVTGDFMGSYPGSTDANGNFQVGAFPPGQYLIKADPDPLLGQYFVSRYYGGDVEKASALPITVTSGNVTGLSIDVAPGGTIEGVITSQSTNLPLDGIDLDIFNPDGSRAPFNASSDIDGTYIIGPMPAGQYIIRADPDSLQAHSIAYYSTTVPNTLRESDASLLTVVAGTATSGRNFNLPPGHNIRGTIRSNSGFAIAGIDLDLYDILGDRIPVTAKSAQDGSYSIGPLPQGQYLLRADPTILQGYATAHYSTTVPNSFYSSEATPLTMGNLADLSGIDFALTPAGAIAGYIRDIYNNPLSGIDLDVYDATGRRVSVTTLSDLNGYYEIGPMPPGSYIIRADPTPQTGYLMEYYPNATDNLLAQPIAVSAGTIASNINFNLEPAGWITGTITGPNSSPLGGIDIDLYNSITGIRVSGNATSNLDGTYVFGPIAPGAYVMRADPTLLQGYAVEYYGGAYQRANAIPFTVTASAGTTNIDVQLEVGGSLNGTVLERSTGTPLASTDIDVFNAAGVRMDQGAITDASGNWVVGPLPPGDYFIRADAVVGTSLADIYSGNSRTLQDATTITLNAGNSLTIPTLQMPVDLVVPNIMMVLSSGYYDIVFPSHQGLNYYLERSPNLQSTSWEVIPRNPLPGTGTQMAIPVQNSELYSSGATFFRVRID